MVLSGKVRFAALDTLRGSAAILVATYHFHGDWTNWQHMWSGHLAVDLFFVLSGFVIAHRYICGPDAISRIEFIGRRLIRLYPLHIFSLLTFVCAALAVWHTLPDYKQGPFAILLENLTLTQNVGFNGELTYNYPNWSVSVEFWVSVIVFLLISRHTSIYVLALVACFGLLVIYWNVPSLDVDAFNLYGYVNGGLVRGASSFLLGVLSYRLFLHEGFRRIPTGYLEAPLIAVILAMIFIWASANGQIDFVAPFVFMLAVPVFAREEGVVSRLLSKASYLGTISYSIYLNQITVAMLFLAYVGRRFAIESELVSLALYLAVLTIYSHFTYLYVEQTSKKWGRRILAARRGPVAVYPIGANSYQQRERPL
jgi:peptidoglycan/LPS O-acetylase OafA/YrhL